MSTDLDRFHRVAQLPDRMGGVKVVCVRLAKVRPDLVAETGRKGTRLEAEDVPGSKAFSVVTAPDRDTGPAVDLPRAVATDRRGFLVDSEDRRAPRRLEGQQRRERFRPRVVVGQDRGVRHDPETGSPAQRPDETATTKVEVATRERHRPS